VGHADDEWKGNAPCLFLEVYCPCYSKGFKDKTSFRVEEKKEVTDIGRGIH